ncbi:FAD-binding oxidoreductase [Zhongshania sp. BJYM1]|uniref:FAD-binding oxidoreductase n=1 Tax=Zhongshania aquatica TaxID=2965069 RepID=UPI0022B56E79|nr:FAD-binding oxidoreductase [Marortus sp. BJYM1]
MTDIEFKNTRYTIAGEETVLDTLLRHKVAIPYGCRAGACQACILQSDASQIPDDCQPGLNPQQIRQGYFLACRCVPDQDMQLHEVDITSQKIPATVSEKFLLDNHTLRLRLNCRIRWVAGQYVTVWIGDIARCYSIASVARLDPFIEFHIRVYPHGAMSSLLYNQTHPGDTLQLQGPLGSFVYHHDKPDQKLLLIGAGTGIAPLIGIARDAIEHGHAATIRLLAGSENNECYEEKHLQRIQNSASQFSYHTERTDNIETVLNSHYPSLRGQRIYICGGEDFVRRCKKTCFMLGASPRDIITEEFINFA